LRTGEDVDMQRSRAGSPYAEPDSPWRVKAKIAASSCGYLLRCGRAGVWYRRTANSASFRDHSGGGLLDGDAAFAGDGPCRWTSEPSSTTILKKTSALGHSRNFVRGNGIRQAGPGTVDRIGAPPVLCHHGNIAREFGDEPYL
jgi:hypothetical protein